MLSAKQANYWYHFNNVFQTQSLTGDWTRDLSALDASTLPLGHVEAVSSQLNLNN